MKKLSLFALLMMLFSSSIFSQSFDEKWGTATNQKNNEQYTEAIASFNSLLNDCDKSGVEVSYCQSQIYNQIARCYYKLKDYTTSAQFAQKAVSQGIGIAEPYTYMIYGKWLGESDFEGAESILKDAESKYSDNKDIKFCAYYIYQAKANKDFDNNNNSSAITNFIKALSYNNAGITHAHLASAYYVDQDYSNAISNYNEAIESGYTNEGQVYYELANCYYAKQDFSTAVNNYNMAISSGHSDVDVYIYMSYSLYALERYSECKSAIQKAINIDPNVLSSQENLQKVWDYVSQL